MGVMTFPIRYSKYVNNFMVITYPLDAALKKTHSLYLGFFYAHPAILYDFKGGWAAPGGLVELRDDVPIRIILNETALYLKLLNSNRARLYNNHYKHIAITYYLRTVLRRTIERA